MKAVELLNKEAQLQSKMNEEEGKYVPGHLASLPKPSAKHTPTFGESIYSLQHIILSSVYNSLYILYNILCYLVYIIVYIFSTTYTV